MSSDTYRNQLKRLQTERAKLESDLSRERKNLAGLNKDASKLLQDIQKARSDITKRSKTRLHQSKLDSIAKSQKKVADLQKKIADKTKSILDAEKKLGDAAAKEDRKRQDTERRHAEDITAELELQQSISDSITRNDQGGSVNISPEAKDAAKQLLEMLENGDIEKEQMLIKVSGGYIYTRDGANKDLPIPIADIRELNAYQLVQFRERRGSARLLLLPQRLRDAIAEKERLDELRIFYSWQSWTLAKHNRYLIEDAIDKAVTELKSDASIKVDPVVDRDTVGKAGAVNIADTIFEKIAASQVFIADVTVVTDKNAPKAIPNPNVMIELGYAAAFLGWERIIGVVNTAYGKIDQLPFDLRPRRLLPYHLPEDASDKSEVRKTLATAIQGAIQIIIDQHYASSDD